MQGSQWEADCFENGLDCITIAGREDGYEFTCRVHPDRPLSELGYLEVEDLLNSLGLRERSLGSWDSVSEFSFKFSDFSQTQELVDEVKAVLRRDRTSRRAVELAAHPAPLEGMARALHSTGLWEGHRLEEAVYILETSAGSGRCVVFKHLFPPLVGLPVSQFRILPEHSTYRAEGSWQRCGVASQARPTS